MLSNTHFLARLECSISCYTDIWVVDFMGAHFNLGMGWAFLILGVVVVVCECV